MTRHWKLFLAVSSIAMVLLVGYNAQAATPSPATAPAPQYVWRFGAVTTPATAFNRAARLMGELMAARSKGQIQSTVYDMEQLGTTQAQLEAVKAGTQDFNLCPLMFHTQMVKWLAALDLPFIFSRSDEAWATFDGWLNSMIAQALQKEGMTFITFVDMGMRDFISKKHPIVKAEDMRGLKYRTMPSPIKRKTIEAWGAQPVFTDLGEVYSLIETGGIDIMDTTASSTAQLKWHEVTRYYSVAHCTFVGGAVVMSKKKFDGLPPDIQKIVMECGQIASYWARVQVWDEDRKAIEQLTKLGMKVNYLAPEELEKFKNLSKPVYKWAAGEYGKEFVERLVGIKIE